MEGIGDDRLEGAKAIAEFIGISARRAYYLAERGLIPCGLEGGTIVGSKKALTEHYSALTRGKVA